MTDHAASRGLGYAFRLLSVATLFTLLVSISGPEIGWNSAFANPATPDNPAAQNSAKMQRTEQITGKKPGETADHSKFEILQQDFKSGPEVTRACLSCHTEAATQVHDSIHWKWDYDNEKTGQKLGKRYVINAFCGNVASNEARCTSCHAGYGWTDMRKDPPAAPEAVDCLVCHADTQYYKKFPAKAGLPVTEPTMFGGKPFKVSNLIEAAQSVGLPQRDNCGACHYYGGGGDGVKHGDIDSSLDNPSIDLDVHMAADGGNMACSACHSGSGHVWPGSRYDMEAKPEARDEEGKKLPSFAMRRMNETASCESCHTDAPHQGKTLEAIKLNNHTDTVACQTCHIPEFARGGVATKMLWDWSTAGQLKDGKPFTKQDDKGHPSYDSKKGDFIYEENVQPTYSWFNGKVTYVTDDDALDTSKPVILNALGGSAEDENARIWPFKLMHTKQPIDAESRKLVYMHLFGQDTDAFWKSFDWPNAIKAGQAYMGKDYSGKFEFVETRMWWPITHMVAPAEKAVQCDECHVKGGRLEDIEGVYIPGRDDMPMINWFGYGLIILTIIGVAIHSIFRFATRKQRQH